MLSQKRLAEILNDYVANDVYNSGAGYVYQILTGECGCTDEELDELGLGAVKAMAEDEAADVDNTRYVRISNIEWDVDDEEDADLLPGEVIAEFEPGESEDDEKIANFLTDTYGFCVKGFTYTLTPGDTGK